MNSQDPAPRTFLDGPLVRCLLTSLTRGTDTQALEAAVSGSAKGCARSAFRRLVLPAAWRRGRDREQRDSTSAPLGIPPAVHSGAERGGRGAAGRAGPAVRTASCSPPTTGAGRRDSDSGLAPAPCFRTGCTFTNGAAELPKKRSWRCVEGRFLPGAEQLGRSGGSVADSRA